MNIIRILLVVAVVAWTSSSAWANGLFYKLPADGSSALYVMKMVGKTARTTATGTLLLSSIGKAKSGGKDCRWIELTWVISQGGQEQVISTKILVPEEDLGKGKNPLKNPQKGWVKEPGEKVKKITDFGSDDAGALPLVLAGPLKNASKLRAKEVATKIGKLQCAGGPYYRATALAEVAAAQVAVGDREDARETLVLAFDAAKRIGETE